MRYWNRLQQVKKQTPSANGFTLIETLIAGLLLTLVISAVGRMGVSTLVGGNKAQNRYLIEQAIENHIQMIQQADSLLTYDNIPDIHRNGETGIARACRKPAEYLAVALKQKGLISNNDWRSGNAGDNLELFRSFPEPGRDIDGKIINDSITIFTDYSYDEDKSIVSVTYTFEAPESSAGIEKRILELNPNFQSECTPYEASSA